MKFTGILSTLKKERQKLAGHLARIDGAIASLGHGRGTMPKKASGRGRRRMSGAVRRKISLKQKANWKMKRARAKA